jgi:hypothetical protein
VIELFLGGFFLEVFIPFSLEIFSLASFIVFSRLAIYLPLQFLIFHYIVIFCHMIDLNRIPIGWLANTLTIGLFDHPIISLFINSFISRSHLVYLLLNCFFNFCSSFYILFLVSFLLLLLLFFV